MQPTRRSFIGGSMTTALALGFAPAAWTRALGINEPEADGPYGPLGSADANGIRLPAGFTSRRVAKLGVNTGPTSYKWHEDPDGGACFAAPDGGWAYVSNAETSSSGGASAIRFDAAGNITNAYRILTGTSTNCAGGPTPWGTWLSCEETSTGRVWECNPLAPSQGVARPALGRFAHEAAAVDPLTGYVYLTEDNDASRLYRFRPNVMGDLSAGVLEAGFINGKNKFKWVQVSANGPYRGKDTTVFKRGEGAWFDSGVLYFTTTTDNRVWAHSPANKKVNVLFSGSPLRSPDNITVHHTSGDIFVAEDGDNLELVLLADSAGTRIGSPFLQLTTGHSGSEITGPAFSPDGTRLYFSSQDIGSTYEVTGPFRTAA